MKSELYRDIEGDDTDSALALIAAGADPGNGEVWSNGSTRSNLFLAIRVGNTEVSLALIEKGADLGNGEVWSNGTTRSNLSHAIEKGNTGVALALIAAGADLDNGEVWSDGSLANLYHAIEKGNIEVALVLIEAGAQLSASIYNEGINNPEIAKAFFQRLCQGDRFPSLSALTMFSLSGVPNQEMIPPRVVEQYNLYAKDKAFLKEHGDKLTPLSEKVAKECGVPQKALSMLVRCAAREGAESRQPRAPGR